MPTEANPAENHIGDPDSWTWDEAEKNYFRFDDIKLKIVWKQAGQAAAVETDTAKSNLLIDDAEGEWMWDEQKKNYFRIDYVTLNVVWKE